MTTDHARLDVTALAAQPVAYWTWAAAQVLLRHIRGAMAREDLSQPQWWTLNHVDGAERGLTRAEVCARLDAYLGELGPDAVGHAADSFLRRGRLTADGAGTLTDDGRAAKTRIKSLVDGMRSQIHEGITDEEYAAALTVLQRMIRNIGGAAGPR
ncbi:MarR family transcriptional regulator [Streptomyces nigrescens]|uniref:MarR family transcriptional regulator n=1 Tax=Streptomyces nigrescens TaxID=1920 RepID=UPI00348FA5C0